MKTISFFVAQNSVFKGFVRYVFASLLCMSKREHSKNNEKCFLFHFKNSFRSWDNQILTFQIFKCHNIIKCLSMKHETHFSLNNLESKHILSFCYWNLASLCNITKEIFLSKRSMKNVVWKLVPGPFWFSKNPH